MNLEEKVTPHEWERPRGVRTAQPRADVRVVADVLRVIGVDEIEMTDLEEDQQREQEQRDGNDRVKFEVCYLRFDGQAIYLQTSNNKPQKTTLTSAADRSGTA